MPLKTAARVLLLLAIAAVAYVSLYPLRLHTVPAGFLTWWKLTWQATRHWIMPGDIVSNILLYVPVGLLFSHSLRLSWHRLITAVLLSSLLSLSMELIQLYDTTRVSSPLDWLANTAGAFAGAVIALAIEPLLPSLPSPTSLLLLAVGITDALLLYVKPESLWGYGIVEIVAGLLLAFEAAGRSRPAAGHVIFALLLATIAWRELSPFQFVSTPQHFEWIPFISSFAETRGAGLVVFVDKAFLYASTVWFGRYAARSILASSGILAFLLLVFELIQRYLPGRTPEISDALLALLAGFVLHITTHAKYGGATGRMEPARLNASR